MLSVVGRVGVTPGHGAVSGGSQSGWSRTIYSVAAPVPAIVATGPSTIEGRRPMFEILPDSNPDLLAIRVSGRLTKADYARLNPWLDEQLAQHPRPALLVDMRDFHGWDGPGAMLDDARFGVTHRNDLRRIAMVGDRAWQSWLATLFAPFMGAELRYFDHEQIDEAWAWARDRVRAAP